MYTALQWSLWLTGLGLQFLLVSTLLAGGWRKHLAVFSYSVILFVTTVVEIIATLERGNSAGVYWACEFARHASLLAVVLASVAGSIQATDHKRTVRTILILAAFAIWGGSFYAQYQPVLDMWMTNAFRNISFTAAIIDLGLWFLLIARPRRQALLLMITGGLGIQMTGEAIGQSLRQLSSSTVMLGGLVAVIAHFVCLYVWLRAFRPAAAAPIGGRESLASRASGSGRAILYAAARARAVDC